MSTRYAVISVGTNSTRVLLADMAPEIPRVALARSIGTRIGEGLKERGVLGDEPMRRTLDAVRSHVAAVRGRYVKLFAIATSAVRRADNGAQFSAEVERITGVPLHIMTGEEEAQASYRGAVTVFGPLLRGEAGVVDAGGGSTEYAVGKSAHAERTMSYEIGAVRLTEAVPQLAGTAGAVDAKTIERARDIARKALGPIGEFPAVELLAFVGGSATTTAAIVRGKRDVIDRYDLTRADLARTLERLCALDLASRKAIVGMKPQRADILPAGIIVLDSVLEILGKERATATTADLLLGYLLAQRPEKRGRTAETKTPREVRQ